MMNKHLGASVSSFACIQWVGSRGQTPAKLAAAVPYTPPCHLPPLATPPPPVGGTVTWPKKHRKYTGAKGAKNFFYKAPKLIHTVILCYSFVVQPPPPRGGTVTS